MTRIEDFRRVYAQLVTAIAGTDDPRLREAFAKVPREHYLGPGPWRIKQYGGDYVDSPSDDPAFLYHNHLVAIDEARGLNNGDPSFLARLIGALAPRPGARIAHIGTGLGYSTAIIAELVGPDGRVEGFEVDQGLAARSRANLSHYPQVTMHAQNGCGLALTGLDGIYVNAGASRPLDAWLDALAPGGRLILPLTQDDWLGAVFQIRREARGYSAAFVSPTAIFHCVGARDATSMALLKAAFARDRAARPWRRVASLRREPHRQDRSCWLHGAGYCLSLRQPNADDDGPLFH